MEGVRCFQYSSWNSSFLAKSNSQKLTNFQYSSWNSIGDYIMLAPGEKIPFQYSSWNSGAPRKLAYMLVECNFQYSSWNSVKSREGICWRLLYKTSFQYSSWNSRNIRRGMLSKLYNTFNILLEIPNCCNQCFLTKLLFLSIFFLKFIILFARAETQYVDIQIAFNILLEILFGAITTSPRTKDSRPFNILLEIH